MKSDSLIEPSLPARPRSRIRIVVPVGRVTPTLQECLLSLEQARFAYSHEMVVVDDREVPDSSHWALGGSIVLRRNEQPGSAARARNCGASGFEGEVLVFVDADVVVEPGGMEKLVRPILEGQAEATVGSYSAEVRGLPFAQAYKTLYLSRVYSRTSGLLRNEFWTALGAVSTAAFRRAGGFSSKYEGAVGEDTDLGHRLTSLGMRILAVPDAEGRHLHRLSWLDLLANDLRKGSQTARLFLQRGKPLSDFRHCHRRDILAVFLACSWGAWLCLAGIGVSSPAVSWTGLGVLLAAYAWARGDLLRVFARPGPWFLIRAAGTMYLLDLVRAVCIAQGILSFRAWPFHLPRHSSPLERLATDHRPAGGGIPQ